MRTGDVRDGGPEVGERSDLMALEPSAERVIHPVSQSGDAPGPRGGPGLFQNRDHRRIVGAVDARRVVGVARQVGSPAGLEQHAVAVRGRPGHLLNVARRIERNALCFRRPERGAASSLAASAELLRPVQAELIAPRGLPREAGDGVPVAVVVESLSVVVEIDGPLRRVARISVEPHAGDRVLGIRIAIGQIEP